MRVLEMVLRVPLDEEAFAAHDGEATAPSNDLGEWDGRDVFRAAELELVEVNEAELVGMRMIAGKVEEEEA